MSGQLTESLIVVTQVRPCANDEEVVVITTGLQSLWPASPRRRIVKVSEQWRFSRRPWRT